MNEQRHNDEEILRKVDSIETRLDRHIEIYKNNGIESKRVADALYRLIEHNTKRDEKIDDMWSKFQSDANISASDTKRLKKVILWGSVISSLAVIIGSVKYLLLM